MHPIYGEDCQWGPRPPSGEPSPGPPRDPLVLSGSIRFPPARPGNIRAGHGNLGGNQAIPRFDGRHCRPGAGMFHIFRIAWRDDRIALPDQKINGQWAGVGMGRPDQNVPWWDAGRRRNPPSAIAGPFRRYKKKVHRDENESAARAFQAESRSKQGIMRAGGDPFDMWISDEKTGIQRRDIRLAEPSTQSAGIFDIRIFRSHQ